MRILATSLSEVRLLEIEPSKDERGFFARVFDEASFAAAGLQTSFPQWSVSFNHVRGTLRGLHWQAAPGAEAKIVRCTQGAIFDVALDVRSGSPTRGRWVAAELSADNHDALYIPAGFAHGFKTLTDDAEVLYNISELHRPDLARGIRWDDPDLAIVWPDPGQLVISDRDRELPWFNDA